MTHQRTEARNHFP